MARVARVLHAVLIGSVHFLPLTRPLSPRANPALGLLRQKASSGYLKSPWPTPSQGKCGGSTTDCVLPCLWIPTWKVRKACGLKLGLSQAFPARALVTQEFQQRTTYPGAHQPIRPPAWLSTNHQSRPEGFAQRSADKAGRALGGKSTPGGCRGGAVGPEWSHHRPQATRSGKRGRRRHPSSARGRVTVTDGLNGNSLSSMWESRALILT